MIRLGAFVGDAELAADASVLVALVAGAVVGQDALDRDAVALEEACGMDQETRDALGGLIGMDLDVDQAGGVVDGDMDMLLADTIIA